MNIAAEKNAPARISAKFTGYNRVQLVRGGKPYFDMLIKLINEARETIHLQVYIFDGDETGQAVANALIAASQRKVAVFVLVDGYASRSLDRALITKMRDAGVCFRHQRIRRKNCAIRGAIDRRIQPDVDLIVVVICACREERVIAENFKRL